MTGLPRRPAEGSPALLRFQRAVERPASRCQGETWVCSEEITCSGRALPGLSDRLIKGNLLRESSLSPEEI